MSRVNVLLIILGVLLLGGYAAWNNFTLSNERAAMQVRSVKTVTFPGKFALVDHNNTKVSEKTYYGRYSLVFFGYTFCPDVCPTVLQDISTVQELLGSDAEKIAPLFISVDPERDTPAVLNDYMSNFHPSIMGLSGTPEAVKAAAKSFHVYYSKELPEGSDEDDYLMSHSGRIYLMDKQSMYLHSFEYGDTPEAMAKKLTEILSGA